MNQLFKFQASWLLLALLPSCGGSSDDGNGGAPTTAELVASCNRTCNKMKTCAGDAGAGFINCDQICTEQNFTPRGQGGQSSGPACDYGRMKAKLDECEKVQCSELTSCYAAAGEICSETPSGSGGSSSTGSGGSATSNGGSTGNGNCAACDEANACCRTISAQAGQDPASCDSFSRATCESYPAAQQATFIQGCTGILAACP